ncbi:Carboxypeptidase regulatory-like domain-containing protein [Bryocella elongata]|uniref:Carboxypeptidase regulatory-like domain-containing protein n=1 Tax=Bryocella elongata TaxID=863522 RepID=A0A1H6C3H3_9BACT|nr:TonB-dependent receptor [Bryocella elongata]SEG67195.1 Carboxypeptidase regulatory-like domain-containing protein [Bryocella elongata]
MKHFLRRPGKAGLLFVASIVVSSALMAQTFRGGISGTVQDPSGAVVPNAKITLVGQDTGLTRETTSTADGNYTFQDLPLGKYTVTITANGFATSKVENITTRPGEVYSLSPKLAMAGSSQSVDVNANALTLDTESTTNTSVVGDKAVANVPLNGRDFTQLIKIVPGYNGAGSLNGTRTNQNNYQIDGADNNDIWQNGAAANQGGVGSIAGVTLPIDAIDQFSVQSQGNAEIGRNGGGLISLAIKSGTNQIHGSAYYFNRNEFFAARSPFLATSVRKPELRNQQFGGSFGGPIMKNRLFYFANYERQMYTIQNSAYAVEPTAAYLTEATSLLAAHGFNVNQLSKNLLVLWPDANGPGAANSSGNYLDPHPQHGYSDNAIGKIDWQISDRQTLSARAFVGTGRQFAAVGTNVFDYYQVAPDITQNFTVAHNIAITPHISNFLVAGVGVFNQTFNDENHSFNMPSLGLADGVTNPSLFGAPTITITSLDVTGETQPLGRKDYTGHLTDTATWIFGKHQLRFGGEYRRNYMDLQYQRNVRGTFTFNGTATQVSSTTNQPNVTLPAGATSYYNDTTYGGSDVRALADYLAGYVASSTFTQGYLRRSIYQNTFSLYASDVFQVLPKFTLNYGIRYDYNAPFNSPGTLSDFRPGTSGADAYGLVQPGQGIDKIFPGNFTNFAPRFGFSYQAAPKLVVRGTYGIFFDAINFNGFFDNRPGNGAAAGVQANPTGATPVETLTATYYQWQNGVNPFSGAASPSVFGLATVDPNFRTAYVQNFNTNLEYQLGRNTVFQAGYVGSLGRRLFQLIDINQATLSPTGTTATANVQTRRPYYTAANITNAKSIAAINDISSIGTSNYNSLQLSIRTSGFHGLTAQGSYTYGHALDTVSGTRGFAPQNSYNVAGEYGNADFDVRNTFNGYVVYEAPKFTEKLKLLTQGWQGNAFISAFTGTPFSVKSGADNSHTGENQDRANQIAAPTAGLTRQLVRASATSAPYYAWVAPTSWTANAANTFGTSARNAYRGPAFATADMALVKNTPVHRGVNFQLRAEMFNVFNRTNLANPTATLTSSSFGRISATRNNSGAPGIGPGEPFNVQFAGKLIF